MNQSPNRKVRSLLSPPEVCPWRFFINANALIVFAIVEQGKRDYFRSIQYLFGTFALSGHKRSNDFVQLNCGQFCFSDET